MKNGPKYRRFFYNYPKSFSDFDLLFSVCLERKSTFMKFSLKHKPIDTNIILFSGLNVDIQLLFLSFIFSCDALFSFNFQRLKWKKIKFWNENEIIKYQGSHNKLIKKHKEKNEVFHANIKMRSVLFMFFFVTFSSSFNFYVWIEMWNYKIIGTTQEIN